MPICLLLSSADTAAGRFDPSSVPDQTMMELLIEGLEPISKDQFLDDDDEYLDVCDWEGVTCEDPDVVAEISLRLAIEGSLALDRIPRQCVYCHIIFNGCAGTFNAAEMPRGLKVLSLKGNKFLGELDTASLPPHIYDLDVLGNQLAGSVVLSTLPQGLEFLNICMNRFMGGLDLTRLPETLEHLEANFNLFDGTINLDHLPKGLTILGLGNNALQGTLGLSQIPPGLEKLVLENNHFTGELVLPRHIAVCDVSQNELEGTAVVHGSGVHCVFLHDNNITAVVDESGGVHPNEKILLAQRREFMGF